ncbi:MAG TPA: DUF3093 domain-containing protein [Jiangellaceae bacterium]|nr:DUF3093 domain-containing protein [Jiangellaceae bacterium]
MRQYRERLRVPGSWWLMPPAATVSVWLAVQHVYGPRVSVPLAAGVLVVSSAWLVGYGNAVVAVEPDGFVAGRARLPLWAVGEVAPLGVDRAHAARGPDADPRAFMLVRGYIGPMVCVAVEDPADPVPYWLVSTRHPDQLAAALSAARDAIR